jgi:hypothetical protein
MNLMFANKIEWNLEIKKLVLAKYQTFNFQKEKGLILNLWAVPKYGSGGLLKDEFDFFISSAILFFFFSFSVNSDPKSLSLNLLTYSH